MGAELDSLQIRITASSKQASDAIDRLVSSLEHISGALMPASSGMDRFASSLDQIVSYSDRLASTAKSLKDLSKVSGTLSAFSDKGNPFTGILTGLRELETVNIPGTLSNLSYIKESISKIGGEAGANAASSLTQIANGLKSFEGVTIPVFGENLTNLALGLRALGSGNIVAASQSLPYLSEGLRELGKVHIDTDVTAISNLAYAVSRFGLANIEKSIVNIPPLANALKDLITTLSSAPAVSENTLRMINSLSNLQVNGAKSSKSIDSLSGSLKRYSTAANKAKKSSLSLASVAGKVYANFFLVFRLFQQLGKAIKQAADLVEVQNVVDVTFGNMTNKMNEFSQSAIETLGMSELTAKQIGSRFQAMGANMGISKEMIKGTNDFVQKTTNGYAQVADSIADVSINLTKLAGDMASFYNKDYEDIAKDLEAAYTGMTRPLRKYGLDLTQATLKEFALANGLNADIKSMTQAEKTLLRYQYIMANTTAAHGDFERTINSFSNQVRLAKQYLNQFMIVLGKIGMYTFKPLVQSFNKAMKRIIELATATLNSLGKIFGWQIEWTDGGVLRDEEEAAGDIADDMGEAADNAKKFKNFLLGIDELNLLPSDDDKDKGGKGLGGIGAGLGDLEGGIKIKPIEKGFESVYDTLYKLGKRIAEVMKDFLKNIDWDTVYKKARLFGRGLADFLNGYLADAEFFYEKGRFIANGINTIANAIDSFFDRFDGWQLGVDWGSYVNGFNENLDWNVIRSAAYEMAHDIAQTINGAFVTIDWKMVGKTIANGLNTAVDFLFTLGNEISWETIGTSFATAINSLFENFDFAKLGTTIAKWIKGILSLIEKVLKRTNWKQIGNKIGQFLKSLDVAGIAKSLASVLFDAIGAAMKILTGMFNEAPFETALLGAFLTPSLGGRFSLGLGRMFTNAGKSVIGDVTSVGRMLGTYLTKGISDYFVGGNTLAETLSTFKFSGMTKLFGGLGTAVLEFKAIEDASYDLQRGLGNVENSIGQIITALGGAAAAFTALFGFPAGLVATGVIATAGAITGAADALEDMREQDVLTHITRDLESNSYTMDELTKTYKDIADNVTSGLDKLSSQHLKLVGMGEELKGIADGFSLVIDAVNSGNSITSGAMQELIGNIEEAKTAWKDYIDSQYEYLIQTTINDYQFAKSSGQLTEELEKDYLARIKGYTDARDNDQAKLDEYLDAYDKAVQHVNDLEAQGATSAAIEGANKSVANALNNLLNLEVAGRAAADEVSEISKEVDNISDDIMNGVLNISFANLDATEYGTFVTELEGYNQQLIDTYDSSKKQIMDRAEEMRENGEFSEEYIEQEVQHRLNILNQSLANIMFAEQKKLYDASFALMGKDVQTFDTYYELVVKPLSSTMDDAWNKATGEEEAPLRSAIADFKRMATEVTEEELRNDDFTFDASGHTLLNLDWIERFYSVREKFLGSYKGMMQDASSESDEFQRSSKNTGKAASTVTSDMNNVNRAMADINSISSATKSGIVDLGEAFGRMENSGKGIEQASTGMKSMNEGVRQFSSQLPSTQSNFKMLSTSMQTDVMGIDVAFKKMYTDTMVNGNKTIAWFKGSFIPLFSTAYWQNILSGIPIAFQNAFTMAFNNVKQMWGQFTQWANENMKLDVTAQKKGNAGTEVKMQFPAYEKGGFPEDGMFFANHTEMVGQFANGRTAVANNEQITDGIERAVYKAMSDVMSNAGGQSVNVELRGDAADFFTAMVNENNKAIMRTGASPIRV